MTASYVLTAAAEADLRDIIRYTRREWGDAQTRSYVAKLTRGIERIAAGQGTSKDMVALYPGLRIVNRRPKGTPYRRPKRTPFVERCDGHDGRVVRAACGVGRA